MRALLTQCLIGIIPPWNGFKKRLPGNVLAASWLATRRRFGRLARRSLWVAATKRRLAAVCGSHVRNRALVEHLNEGFKRLIEQRPRRLIARSDIRLGAYFRRQTLHRPHDVSDPNAACRVRELDAAVSTAHGLDEAGSRQEVHDLERVLCGQFELLGEFGDLDQRTWRSGTSDQQTYRMVGSLVQSHLPPFTALFLCGPSLWPGSRGGPPEGDRGGTSWPGSDWGATAIVPLFARVLGIRVNAKDVTNRSFRSLKDVRAL